MTIALTAVLSGCGACEEGEHSVPFKRDEPVSTPTLAAPDAATDAGADAFVPVEGGTHPTGTQRIDFADGTSIEIADGTLRAWLTVDLDADADLDALLVTATATGELVLARAERRGDSFTAPHSVAALGAGAEACALETPSLRRFAAGFVSVHAETRCAASLSARTAAGLDDAAPAPTSTPTPHAPPSPAEHLWIVTIEPLPRIAEHVSWESGSAREPGAVVVDSVALSSADLDADGHADIELKVALRRTLDPEPFTLTLALFDRPAGLARDPAQPEASLRRLADGARDALRRDPARALASADRVLALHAAVCREAGRASLRFDDASGLACGRSRAAGRAAAVRAAALARTGALLAAIEAYDALATEAYDVPGVDRDRAREALAAQASKTLSWRKGPALDLASGPAARLSAVAFVDEDTLLLRGNAPRNYALADGAESPTGVAGDVLVSDPSGHFAIVGVVRTCEGHALRTVLASQVVAGIVGGRSVSEPLVLASAPPPGARCPGKLLPPLRDDAGGWRVLDWTESGVLLVRAGELWRLALDEAAKAAQPAVRVAATEDAQPRHAGALSTSGRHLALVTQLGVAVVDRATGAATLVPFAGSELAQAAARTALDVAVSPSGRRVAIAHAGHVFVASEQAPAPATPIAPAIPNTTPTTPAAPIAPEAPPAPDAPTAQAPTPPPAPDAPSTP